MPHEHSPVEIRVQQWPFVRLPSTIVVDRSLSDGDKITYAALLLWGGTNGRAFPSKGNLAKARAVSTGTLYRHLASLEERGWIRRTEEQHRNQPLHVVHVYNEPIGCLKNESDPLSNMRHPPSQKRDTEREYREREPEREVSPKGDAPVGLPLSKQWEDADACAKDLNKVYPHGWTESNVRRAPNLKKTRLALGVIKRRGTDWAEVYDAALRYKAVIGGTDDQRYAPALWKWVKEDAWQEVPERINPAAPPMDPEEIERMNHEKAQRAHDRVVKRARQAGVDMGGDR